MGKDNASGVLADVADYFTAKLEEHGSTPRGADLNSEKSQHTRFEQLVKIFNMGESDSFSINDLGCGYGAFYDYIKDRYPNITYNGYDISAAMISEAKSRHAQYLNTHYWLASEPTEDADYGVESGIFNLHFGSSYAEWDAHIKATLDALDRTSRRGFAFNCLTSYSDMKK